jgi:transcription elongation factor GreB
MGEQLAMDKAFVKDDDAWQDPEIELDPRADIPAGSRNYMTPRGVRRLRDELHDLLRHSRPQLLADVNRLNREGSGRTDAACRDARKSLQRLESRIAFLFVLTIPCFNRRVLRHKRMPKMI